MKIASMVALLGMLHTGHVLAQSGGHFGLYSDSPGFSDCFLTENLGTVNQIYVVHKLAPEALAVQFKVSHNWVNLWDDGQSYHGIALGDAYEGVLVHYLACTPMPLLVVTLSFIPFTHAPPCTVLFEVVPDPDLASGQIEVTDCDGNVVAATGGVLVVNGNEEDCPCTVSTEETSWSQVKALYR